MGKIRGVRGSRPFKLVNEIMSLTKVVIQFPKMNIDRSPPYEVKSVISDRFKSI